MCQAPDTFMRPGISDVRGCLSLNLIASSTPGLHAKSLARFSTGDAVPQQLADARASARAARLAENRARRCAVCA